MTSAGQFFRQYGVHSLGQFYDLAGRLGWAPVRTNVYSHSFFTRVTYGNDHVTVEGGGFDESLAASYRVTPDYVVMVATPPAAFRDPDWTSRKIFEVSRLAVLRTWNTGRREKSFSIDPANTRFLRSWRAHLALKALELA